ncbi:MAG: cupin domain-containing protein [Shimia sp.]
MPKVDLDALAPVRGSSMPFGLAAAMAGRVQWPVATALSQLGANVVELAPGAASALRHWHEEQDEILVVLEGTATLVEDDGPTRLAPGDVAVFPAGVADGHHVVNRSEAPVRFLVVGTQTPTEVGHYPDHDLQVRFEAAGGTTFHRADGAPSEIEETP